MTCPQTTAGLVGYAWTRDTNETLRYYGQCVHAQSDELFYTLGLSHSTQQVSDTAHL